MDLKRLLFSALIGAGIGVVVGLAVSQVVPTQYQSKEYATLARWYPLIGAFASFFGGGIISAAEQLNEQSNRQKH